RPRRVRRRGPRPREAICPGAMRRRPAARYATPRQLAADIEQWLADEPVSAWPEPWTVKARRWVGKHRTLVTGAAAALLVGVISLTVSTVLLVERNNIIETKNKELSEANIAIDAESKGREQQRLIAVAAQKKAEERLDQSVDTLKLFANDVRNYCEDAIVPGKSKEQMFNEVLRNLEALAAAEKGKDFNEDKVRARVFLYETVALTQIELARSKDALDILEKAQEASKEWLAARPDDVGALGRRAAILHLYGVVHGRRLNDQLANKYYTEAYEIRKKLFGNEKVERFTPGKTRMDLADSLDALERWDDAIKMRHEAYDFVVKHIAKHGEKSADRAFALDALNWTYQKAAEKTDDYEKRKSYLDEANKSSAELHRVRPTGRVALQRWAKNLQ